MTFLEQIQEWTKEYQRCRPLNASKKAVYDFASNLREQMFDPLNKIDMFDIIKRIGGKIHVLSLFEYVHQSGSIFIHNRGNFDIIIPEFTSPIRDIFTLAHELGHYILHSEAGAKSKLWANRYGSGPLEWEANWFAAAFLVPKTILEKLSSEKSLTPEMVSAFSGISHEAARIRVETFLHENI